MSLLQHDIWTPTGAPEKGVRGQTFFSHNCNIYHVAIWKCILVILSVAQHALCDAKCIWVGKTSFRSISAIRMGIFRQVSIVEEKAYVVKCSWIEW